MLTSDMKLNCCKMIPRVLRHFQKYSQDKRERLKAIQREKEKMSRICAAHTPNNQATRGNVLGRLKQKSEQH